MAAPTVSGILDGVPRIEMSAGIGAMIVASAVTRGAAREALLAATAFDPGAASDPDARISLELEERLWTEAARLAEDDALGLHAAEMLVPGAFGVLDYAVRTAPTLRTALERLARYNRLVHDVAVFTLHDRPPGLRVEHAFRTPGAEQCRHSAEFTIASLVTVGGQLLGEPLRADGAGFAHPKPTAPAALAELRRVFGFEPRFAERVNWLELDASLVDRPLPRADSALSRVIERHAEALLAALPPLGESASDRVRHLLSRALGEGTPTLGSVASKLKTSERSLQRKLADEGTSFELLLDEVRQQLALRYLADRTLAVSEVAYLLGYSEPSPFHRAFKRWTGKTPAEMRGRAA